MQFTIHFPGILPHERIVRYVQQIEQMFQTEGLTVQTHEEDDLLPDPWDALNPEEIAIDTGIVDFAAQHDHYLYGIQKRP